jgi:hypothetical protein
VSYQLTANGGEAAYFRLPGTANAVLGFVTSETTQTYNNTALGTTYFLQAGDGYASFGIEEIIAVVSFVSFAMLTSLFNIILTEGGAVPPSAPALLLESGGYLLLESGGKILLE